MKVKIRDYRIIAQSAWSYRIRLIDSQTLTQKTIWVPKSTMEVYRDGTLRVDKKFADQNKLEYQF